MHSIIWQYRASGSCLLHVTRASDTLLCSFRWKNASMSYFAAPINSCRWKTASMSYFAAASTRINTTRLLRGFQVPFYDRISRDLRYCGLRIRIIIYINLCFAIAIGNDSFTILLTVSVFYRFIVRVLFFSIAKYIYIYLLQVTAQVKDSDVLNTTSIVPVNIGREYLCL